MAGDPRRNFLIIAAAIIIGFVLIGTLFFFQFQQGATGFFSLQEQETSITACVGQQFLRADNECVDQKDLTKIFFRGSGGGSSVTNITTTEDTTLDSNIIARNRFLETTHDFNAPQLFSADVNVFSQLNVTDINGEGSDINFSQAQATKIFLDTSLVVFSDTNSVDPIVEIKTDGTAALFNNVRANTHIAITGGRDITINNGGMPNASFRAQNNTYSLGRSTDQFVDLFLTGDIRALGQSNLFDLNVGSGNIQNNSLNYSLVDLNRSALSVCSSDLNSTLNSQNQCINLSNFNPQDITGKLNVSDYNVSTLTGGEFGSGGYLFPSDLNAVRINTADFNVIDANVTNNLHVGADLNVDGNMFGLWNIRFEGPVQIGAYDKNAIARGTGRPIAIGSDANAFSTANAGAIAIGDSALATGDDGPIAIGANSRATKDDTVAFGSGAKADGIFSTALGRGSDSRDVGSVCVGAFCDSFSSGSVAVGYLSNAEAVEAIAVGFNAGAFADDSIAIGGSAVCDSAGPFCISIGADSDGGEDYAIAIGGGAQALGVDSIAIGRNAAVSGTGDGSFQLGTRVGQLVDANTFRISSYDDINFEGNIQADGFITTDDGNIYHGTTRYSLSDDLNANAGTICDVNSALNGSLACISLNSFFPQDISGKLNVSDYNVTTLTGATFGSGNFVFPSTLTINLDLNLFTGQANLFDVNIGSGNLKVNGVEYSIDADLNLNTSIFAGGNIDINANSGDITVHVDDANLFANIDTNVNLNNIHSLINVNSIIFEGTRIQIGNTVTNASAANAIAIGSEAIANAADAIAIGFNASSGSASLALGTSANAIINNVCLGASSNCTVTGAIGIGRSVEASANNSLAIGREVVASGARSIALGGFDTASQAASASGERSIAIGFDSNATGINSIAFGAYIDVISVGSMAISDGERITLDDANTFLVNYDDTNFTGDVNVAGEIRGSRVTFGYGDATSQNADVYQKTIDGVLMTANDGYRMLRAGSITGHSTLVDITNASMALGVTFEVRINNSNQSELENGFAGNTSGTRSTSVTIARGTVTFAEGDIIQIFADRGVPSLYVWEDVIGYFEVVWNT